MFYVNYADYMRTEKDRFEVFRPSGTEDYLFIYFTTPMKITINGNEVYTEKNACVFLNPNTRHKISGYPRFQNSYIHFCDDNEFLKKFLFPRDEIFYPENFSELNHILKKIRDEVLHGSVFAQDMIDSYITELLILIERGFCDENTDRQKIKFRKLRYNMLENYRENPDVDKLAASVCMSRTGFYKMYKKYFNTTPKQELIKTRMEVAQVLLTNVNLKTVDIAEMVGFESVEHFTRYYKKYFGVSPRYKL